MLNWRPKVAFDDGVKKMITEIENWKNAPLWTPSSIKKATESWFNYMSKYKTNA